jgi:hypothetical protein
MDRDRAPKGIDAIDTAAQAAKASATVQIARRIGMQRGRVRAHRKQLGVLAAFKQVDTCAAEFEAQTAYCYGSYDEENEVAPLSGKK